MAGQEICTGSALTATFAGGEGLHSNPYLICTASQLQNVNTQVNATPTAHFKLLRDIDLNPYSKAFFTKQTGIQSVNYGSIFLYRRDSRTGILFVWSI